MIVFVMYGFFLVFFVDVEVLGGGDVGVWKFNFGYEWVEESDDIWWI